jgi:soluble cytochrome b562
MLRTIRQIKHFSGCYRKPFLISTQKMSFTKSIKQLDEIIGDIEKSLGSKPVKQKTQKVQEPVDEVAKAKELFATTHIQVRKNHKNINHRFQKLLKRKNIQKQIH